MVLAQKPYLFLLEQILVNSIQSVKIDQEKVKTRFCATDLMMPGAYSTMLQGMSVADL